MGNPNLGYIFPGYGDYAPLNIVQGTTLRPITAICPSRSIPCRHASLEPGPGGTLPPPLPTPAGTPPPAPTPVGTTGNHRTFLPFIARR